MKHGDIEDSLKYANKFQNELILFVKTGRRINDRMKCRLILTKNKVVLKILSII